MSTTSSVITKKLIGDFFHFYPEEAARLLGSFTSTEIIAYLKNLPVSSAAQIIALLNRDIVASLLEEMEATFFIELFTEIDASLAARLLAPLATEAAEKFLELLPDYLSRELKELMTYPRGTAGYIMDSKFLSFHPYDTVDFVFERIRASGDRRIVNIHVVDDGGHLAGVIPLQEVAVSGLEEQLEDHIKNPVVSIQAMSPRDEVVQLMEERNLISLPVVDLNGILLGIIRYDGLVKAAKQEATEGLQAMFGAGREERALSNVSFATRKRLPWLEINLVTAFLASAVVGLFEETIARLTILAVFLPVVAGQSGNTGSQALAVTMRGLALREIRSRHWFQVARKEIAVGFINGCVVALTTSVVVYFWAASFGLAVVIAIAMVISMVMAGLSGAVIPILLNSIGQDPAQSSSIILTTVTDVVGFMSFLGLATLLSGMLNI